MIVLIEVMGLMGIILGVMILTVTAITTFSKRPMPSLLSRVQPKVINKPDYVKILRLENQLYQKVLTTTDWRGNKLNVSPTRVFPPIPDIKVDSTGHYALNGVKKCNLNSMLGPPCRYGGDHNRTEVWVSNKHIITRNTDVSDTWNIIEGEGLD